MKKPTLHPIRVRVAVLFLCLGGTAIGSRAATILTDNLSAASAGSDSVSGDVLLGADFSTDSSAYRLDSVTLLLREDTAGAASLNLYSDNGGIPGSLLSTLSSSGSYSSSLLEAVFTASGVTLEANTTYWLVLEASSGAFEWSWAATNTGSGSGYTGNSAYFDGSYWYGTSGVYPYQMSVTADPAGASSEAPEPTSFGLVMAALGIAMFGGQCYFRQKQS